MAILVNDAANTATGQVDATLGSIVSTAAGMVGGTADVVGTVDRALGSVLSVASGAFIGGGGGGPIYTDVTRVPPAQPNNPLVLTTMQELQPYLQDVPGISNSPDDKQYIILGDGTRDITINLTGQDHLLDHPMRVDNWIHNRLVALGPAFTIKQQKYSYPTPEFPYPKVPGGGALRVAPVRTVFLEGCDFDMFDESLGNDQPLNADYVIWRGTYMSPSDYASSSITYQNCLFRGMEGRGAGFCWPKPCTASSTVYGDTMYHPDYFQNQSKTDPVGRPKATYVENCNLSCGSEGWVFHAHSQGTNAPPTLLLRNVDSHITNEWANQYDANVGTHFAMEAIDLISQCTLENVWYSNYNGSGKCLRLANPTRFYVDPQFDGQQGWIGNSNLNHYQHQNGAFGQNFVTPENLRGAYVSPH